MSDLIFRKIKDLFVNCHCAFARFDGNTKMKFD